MKVIRSFIIYFIQWRVDWTFQRPQPIAYNMGGGHRRNLVETCEEANLIFRYIFTFLDTSFTILSISIQFCHIFGFYGLIWGNWPLIPPITAPIVVGNNCFIHLYIYFFLVGIHHILFLRLAKRHLEIFMNIRFFKYNLSLSR